MMDRIRSARMKIEYADIEMKKEESVQQPSAAVQIPLLFVNIYCMALSKKAAAL
jgi:hypothetical protein